MPTWSLCWLLISALISTFAENGAHSFLSTNNHENSRANLKNTFDEETSLSTTTAVSNVILPKRSYGQFNKKGYRFGTTSTKQESNRNQNQISRSAPFFEEDGEPQNITARIGTIVQLDCKIALLQNKTVSWLHRRGETIYLLTVGRQTYSSDGRISLNFRYPNNWRLQINSLTHRDEGIYECQVATHPPTIKIIRLSVTAPEVEIIDEKGLKISERYYKTGSHVDLTCRAVQVKISEDRITWWKLNVLIAKGITTNSTTNSSNNLIWSTLKIDHAEKHHSGNYTCSIGQLAASSVQVHILNGELPAAIHDSSSGTMACCFITTTWLFSLCSIISAKCTFYHNL